MLLASFLLMAQTETEGYEFTVVKILLQVLKTKQTRYLLGFAGLFFLVGTIENGQAHDLSEMCIVRRNYEPS